MMNRHLVTHFIWASGFEIMLVNEKCEGDIKKLNWNYVDMMKTFNWHKEIDLKLCWNEGF